MDIVITICPRFDASQNPGLIWFEDVDQSPACCRLTACGFLVMPLAWGAAPSCVVEGFQPSIHNYV